MFFVHVAINWKMNLMKVLACARSANSMDRPIYRKNRSYSGNRASAKTKAATLKESIKRRNELRKIIMEGDFPERWKEHASMRMWDLEKEASK